MKKILPLIVTLVFIAFTAQVHAQNLATSRIVKTGEDEGIDVSSNDAEQENNAMDKLYDDDLDMGWEGDDFNIMTTGLRFTNLQVPQGAKIDSAFIEIYAHEDEADSAYVTIWGQDADDTETFDEENLITARPKTDATYRWEISENWTMWEMYRTPDLSEIVQEIINRDGWLSGNSLVLIFGGEDQGASELDNARDFESFENVEDPEDGGDGENHPERVPKLYVYYSVEGSTTVTSQIIKTGEDEGMAVSSDDAEQENNAMDKLYDDDLDMGWEGDDFNIMTTGLRFTDIQVPQGATIESAYLEIYAHEDEADSAYVTIWGQDADDTETFDEENLITARPSTDATYRWEISENWTMWEMYTTPDISDIIQEIVSREGWSAGNSLVLVFQGEDQGASELDNARDFESFENVEDSEDGGDGENHPERVPKLYITYSNGSSAVIANKVTQLNLYPNPASDVVSLTLKNAEATSTYFYNINGSLVKTVSGIKSNSITIDISDLQKGIYMVKTVSNKGIATQRLMIK